MVVDGGEDNLPWGHEQSVTENLWDHLGRGVLGVKEKVQEDLLFVASIPGVGQGICNVQDSKRLLYPTVSYLLGYQLLTIINCLIPSN
jgi:hypothetical protein